MGQQVRPLSQFFIDFFPIKNPALDEILLPRFLDSSEYEGTVDIDLASYVGPKKYQKIARIYDYSLESCGGYRKRTGLQITDIL